jgi:hypothetical protein
MAQRLAISAEHAHRVLTRSLQFSASQRTEVLLTDEADIANDVAAVVPRNEIHLLAAVPEVCLPSATMTSGYRH